MSYANGPKIVTDGLILYLDAANRKSYPGSGTSWNDLAGNVNSTSLVNGPSFQTANGGYIKLDGTNDYCRIPFNSAFNVISNPFTVLVWARKDDTAGFYSGLITADLSGDNTWKIFRDQNTNFFRCRSGSSYWSFPNFTVGKWHCYAFTKSGVNAALYFDGNLSSSYTNAANPAPFSNDLAIGSYRLNDAINGSWLIPLSIGPTMFYSRALSSDEIRRNYNALKGRYGLT